MYAYIIRLSKSTQRKHTYLVFALFIVKLQIKKEEKNIYRKDIKLKKEFCTVCDSDLL